jgi:hypothetical protein
MPQAATKDLQHLFDVLEGLQPNHTKREPPNEPPSTPVFQHHSQLGPDIVQLKQLLVKLIHDGYPSVRPCEATESAQTCFAGNEQEENVQAAELIDLQAPIGTTPDDFKAFEKWASHASTPRDPSSRQSWKCMSH